MSVDTKEFEYCEQELIKLISEFQALSISESNLREALRSEAARAEAAEASRDATQRMELETRANFVAATTKASQMGKELAAAQEELTTVKIHLEFADRQRNTFEGKYTEMANKTELLEKELQSLRPIQAAQSTLQRIYTELQERAQKAMEDARNETSRLETELRRVERCAGAGAELRERARLAAAAHTRERRLASAELQHTARELKTALAEITRQGMLITELECRISKSHDDTTKKIFDPEFESFTELKATLEAERAGTKRLEKALAEALADNAYLAAQLHNSDNNDPRDPSLEYNTTTNICPIDSFLAE